jgi:hypothetical protein
MGNASLLETVGGVSAFLAAATLVVGIVGLVRRVSRVRPWLAVMFGINAGVGDVSQDSLGQVPGRGVTVRSSRHRR